MNSVVGGTYPGAGIVLGTGLTFGYIAAQTIAEGANKQQPISQSVAEVQP
jgi:hypothetical protein